MSPRMDNINNFSLSNNNENNNNIVEINNAINDNDNLNDEDDDLLNDIYDPDEQSLTKYNLIMCELYHTRLHGDIDTTNIYNYYLVMWKYKKLNMITTK